MAITASAWLRTIIFMEYRKDTMLGYVKRTIFPGIYRKTIGKAALDKSAVILSDREYQSLLEKAARVESVNTEIKKRIKEREQEIFRQVLRERKKDATRAEQEKNRIERRAYEYEQLAVDMKKLAEEYKTELDEQRSLNDNLKRISRERANSKRGLKPKKTHPGYIILDSQEIEINVRYLQRQVRAWRSTIQTPYDATIPLATIQHEIEADLESQIFSLMGIRAWTQADDNGFYRTFHDSNGDEVCGEFKRQYKRNFRTGFWEIYIYHTSELTAAEELVSG